MCNLFLTFGCTLSEMDRAHLLHNMNIKFDESKAMKIMDHNLVCSNFFDWDFDNWKPQAERKQGKEMKKLK